MYIYLMLAFSSCSCSICKVLCPSNKMDWLSTSAEHMNSHAMHFPCLKANAVTNNNNNNNNTNNNNNNNNNELNSNRVLACKDCKDYLASQWETMDAERVPLEHRRLSILLPFMCTCTFLTGALHLQIQHSLAHADLQFTKRISPRRHEYQHSALHTIHIVLDACQHINLLLSVRPALGPNVSQSALCQ